VADANLDAEKKLAAEAAAELVSDEMMVGWDRFYRRHLLPRLPPVA